MTLSSTAVRPKAQAILGDPSYRGALPASFAYGAATAAYQIEGAIDVDGKGPCVWDECLRNQDNGDLACDSYHQWREDVKLLKEYGCGTYRFSIAWSRVNPLGKQTAQSQDSGEV
jgi:beta-glucosidase/6-phospho-beta-glucosidase/beta-galactosidase